MLKQTMPILRQDSEAAKRLADFLPDKIFDAHAHLFDTAHLPSIRGGLDYDLRLDIDTYKREMSPLLLDPKELRLNVIAFPDAAMKWPDSPELRDSDRFIVEQLEKDEGSVAEIIVSSKHSADELEKRLVHPRIRGFKCYHLAADRERTWDASIDEYLPEAAWEVASKHHMCITLHMVKDKALSDPDNLNYIRKMAKRYPDTTLILAHAARSFAAWTGIEAVEKIADLENVYFDFSAVCESPAMQQIVKKAGVSRCLWGSDYPVCRGRGKAISLADSFYWIYENDLNAFSSKTTLNHWLIALENLYAVKEMATLADLSRSDVEDIFYNNAMRLWGLK